MKAARLRRVRFTYPQAMMNLAIALSLRWEKRDVAKALHLPLSTIYRWLVLYRGDSALFHTTRVADEERLRHLAEECRSKGFDVSDLQTLDPALTFQDNYPREDIGISKRQDPKRPRSAAILPLRGRTPLSEVIDYRDAQDCLRSNETIMELARHAIDQHYYSKLSCEELASSAGMSKWHFIRIFKSVIGVSPYQYLTSIRVERAKYLLRSTTHSLESVATAVGFDSLSSLCRAFKKIEGVSLSSFYHGLRLGYSPLIEKAFNDGSSIRRG